MLDGWSGLVAEGHHVARREALHCEDARAAFRPVTEVRDAPQAAIAAPGSGGPGGVVLVEIVEQVESERTRRAFHRSVPLLEAEPGALDRALPEGLLVHVSAGEPARSDRQVVAAPQREVDGLRVGEAYRAAVPDLWREQA